MKLDFNADEVEVVDDDFSPLPPGNYPVIVESSEFKETRAGNGKFLLLQLMVIDGKGKNRKLFDRLNLENPNPQAVEIAKKQLASLCRAMGKQKIADSSELHDNPVVARVEIQKGYIDEQVRAAQDFASKNPHLTFTDESALQRAKDSGELAQGEVFMLLVEASKVVGPGDDERWGTSDDDRVTVQVPRFGIVTGPNPTER